MTVHCSRVTFVGFAMDARCFMNPIRMSIGRERSTSPRAAKMRHHRLASDLITVEAPIVAADIEVAHGRCSPAYYGMAAHIAPSLPLSLPLS